LFVWLISILMYVQIKILCSHCVLICKKNAHVELDCVGLMYIL